jgi:glycerol-3-phosphate acyltransferase PlsY
MPNQLEHLGHCTTYIDQNFEEARTYHRGMFIAFLVNWILLIFLVFFYMYFQNKYVGVAACTTSLVVIMVLQVQEFIQWSYTTNTRYIRKFQNAIDVLFIVLSIAFYTSRILMILEVVEGSLEM